MAGHSVDEYLETIYFLAFPIGEYRPDPNSSTAIASRVAEMLGLELAVACHYLEPDGEVQRFLELVPHHDTTGRRRAVAPLVGQTLVVDGDRHWIDEAA